MKAKPKTKATSKSKATSKVRVTPKTRAAKPKAARVAKPKEPGREASLTTMRVREIDALRHELDAKRAELLPRWNADPEDVQRSVAQLVLSLVEFLRKLLERQAIRRMEHETLSEVEIERVGIALMRLESTVHEMAAQFGLSPEELNLDLGPLGRLS